MEIETQSISPWLSIWIKPKETIREIVATDPKKYVIILAMLAGIGQTLDRAASRNAGNSLPLIGILALAIILGPIGGIISLYYFGAFLRWTGSWLGGKASSQEVRSAVAWSSIPTIIISLLWIPKLLIFGDELFKSYKPIINTNPSLAILLLVFSVIDIIGAIWSLVIFFKCLGEVHRFSTWKALGASLLGLLVVLAVMVPILCLISVFGSTGFR